MGKKRWKVITLYHKYYRISGLYKFLFRNISRIALIIIAILLVFVFIERYIIDFDVLFNDLVSRLRWQSVILIFFISETFFGLIPPDLFIIWAEHFPNNFLVLTYLAILSYFGGILSFKIGNLIRRIKKINAIVNYRFKDHIVTIKKWGGMFIVISALFPLPFATISMIAGVMKYPARYYLFFGLTRIIRFYIYALFLFKII